MCPSKRLLEVGAGQRAAPTPDSASFRRLAPQSIRGSVRSKGSSFHHLSARMPFLHRGADALVTTWVEAFGFEKLT